MRYAAALPSSITCAVSRSFAHRGLWWDQNTYPDNRQVIAGGFAHPQHGPPCPPVPQTVLVFSGMKIEHLCAAAEIRFLHAAGHEIKSPPLVRAGLVGTVSAYMFLQSRYWLVPVSA